MLPFVPQVHLEAEVVLLGLLPPLLYAAAIQTSLVDFSANRGSILLLSVGLVVLTTVAVGAMLRLLLPDLGWPAALAIGAVVAPPDAVAATAIARRIGLPRQVVTVLEGESLLNDATALVALRTAIAAMTGGIAAVDVGLDFLVAAGGGTLIGLLVFGVVAWVRRHLGDPVLDTAVSFVTPFLAYLLAEEVHASGVIAVVVAGLLLGHQAPWVQTAASRNTESITWRTVAFLLENVVFLLIGLQARWILTGVVGGPLPMTTVVGLCVATLVTVVVVRVLWVLAIRPLLCGSVRRSGREVPRVAHSLLIGWAGMRGVVTLAAAFIIPEDTAYRPLLLLIGFTVVAGTLFLQGLTLPWLTRRLRVEPPDPAEDVLYRATLLQQAGAAGLARLDSLADEDPYGVVERLRSQSNHRAFAAWERLATVPGQESPSRTYARLRQEMIEAERDQVLQVRREGRVPSEVVRGVLAMLDVEESTIETATRAFEGVRSDRPPAVTAAAQCAELTAYPAVATAPDPRCERCEQEGTRPVALRQCLTCGSIGCCDSSPGQHATEHFHRTGHPVIESAEPDESWRWCYVHHQTA